MLSLCVSSGVTPDTKYELRLSAATKNGFPASLGGWSHFTTPKADIGRSSLFCGKGSSCLKAGGYPQQSEM